MNLKKFPVKLAVEQEDEKYVYGSHITNFGELTAKIDETNELLTENNALLVDANGHLVDANGNLVEIGGELVSINTVEGTIEDDAVSGDNDGTISAKLRGISIQIGTINDLLTANNTLLVDANGHLVDVNGNLAEIDGELVSINTVEGLITDAAVTGDSNGTISAKLRGITTQLARLMPANNFATGQTALSTTAAQIVAARSTRKTVTIVNLSTIDIYVGATGVTSSTGLLLLGTKGASVTLDVTGAIFAIAASGTPAVSFVEEYNV